MYLNIGCGPDKKVNFVNYDIQPIGDVQGDCEKGLAFADETFSHIYASHILEHIKDLRALKKELWRVMKPGATLVVITPYYLSPDAWGDDDHCRAFSEQSFFGDFWPGFKVETVASQHRIKLANNQKVKWLYALIRKCDA